MTEERKYKVAVAQTAPPYPPRKTGALEKACRLVEEAGGKGAQMVVFPESFISGYPNWSIEARQPLKWDRKWLDLVKEAIVVPGPETDQLCEVAKSTGTMVCLGANERDANYPSSIYNSLIFISSNGEYLGRHRKLTPAYREKVFWTSGSPQDLRCVHKTSLGRVGGLICAEHLNPLLKSAMAIQGEEIHIACYPGWSLLPKHVMDTSIRQYAIVSVFCACFLAVS